jgi:hypothetical protein
MSVESIEHIKNFNNDEIETKDDYKMKIPKELPQGFFSLLSVGNSGSGKTNATLNLIKKLKPYYNVYILISPTGCFDEERQKRGEQKYDTLNIKFDEEHQAYHRGLISEIIMRQKRRLINYEEWLRYAKVYKKAIDFLSKCIDKNEESIYDFKDVNFLMKFDFCKPNDPNHFTQMIPPTAMLIIDDMASTPIYTNALGELVNLQMKNRHLKMSVLNLVQAYKLCPRSIRLNSTVMMLFPCKSKKMVLEFADTCNNHYTPEEFMKLYEYATKNKPHDFLYIDCREKMGFRKNFNERIHIKDGLSIETK